ncbi:hypothetical protein ASG60_20815 [Methylobacterium sp. Leaf469]|nr:hypothetical protein ASG60_20815 [Methylobacterium sp. Leaf469]
MVGIDILFAEDAPPIDYPVRKHVADAAVDDTHFGVRAASVTHGKDDVSRSDAGGPRTFLASQATADGSTRDNGRKFYAAYQGVLVEERQEAAVPADIWVERDQFPCTETALYLRRSSKLDSRWCDGTGQAHRYLRIFQLSARQPLHNEASADRVEPFDKRPVELLPSFSLGIPSVTGWGYLEQLHLIAAAGDGVG